MSVPFTSRSPSDPPPFSFEAGVQGPALRRFPICDFLKAVCKKYAWVYKHSHHMFCRGKVTGGSPKVKNHYCCQKQSLSVDSGENACKLNTLKKMNIFNWMNAKTCDSWLLLESNSNRQVAKSLLRQQLQKDLPAAWCSRLTIRCLTVSMSCLHFSQK